MISLGTHLLPVAGKVVDLFSTQFVPALLAIMNGIGDVVTASTRLIAFFAGASPAADAVKGALLTLGSAMLGMAASAIPAAITAVMASVTAFGAQIIAAGAAAIATLAAAAPFIAVGAAIGAVIGVIILLGAHWKQATAVIGTIDGVAQNVGAAIGSAIGAVIGWFNQWKGVIGVVAGILAAVFWPDAHHDRDPGDDRWRPDRRILRRKSDNDGGHIGEQAARVSASFLVSISRAAFRRSERARR